ncbi:hypothetical protein DSECCO2_382020 [anaerobic digester metagenome]
MLQKINSQQKASANSKKLGVKPPKWEGSTMETYHQYLNQAIRFRTWSKANFGTRHYDDCRNHYTQDEALRSLLDSVKQASPLSSLDLTPEAGSHVYHV